MTDASPMDLRGLAARLQIETVQSETLGKQGTRYRKERKEAAEAIIELLDRAERLEAALKKSAEGWSNVIELGLIPRQHIETAVILRDEARAALASRETKPRAGANSE